ncbi:S8 family serine peptidase [Pseudomonas fluorescens]|uniref:S8 family serine peptidase n=1 Tax=Pseudomonas fluorescens TaxID=294 RepID=UPI001A9FB664|nr:S8 family serine peptidase [Pseudomonas fluorescens]QTD31303.1 S8 family serine peptidase [Pseudomonas fluorescens]
MLAGKFAVSHLMLKIAAMNKHTSLSLKPLLYSLALLAPTTHALQLFPSSISIEPARINSSNSIKILNEIAKPTSIKISKGENPLDAVRSSCGIINPNYLPIFLEANPGLTLEAVTEDTTLVLPACFVVAPKKILVEKGDNLASIAARHYGSSGINTLSIIVDANKTNLNCNPKNVASRYSSNDLDHCILQPGQSLSLPNVPVPANYVARDIPDEDLQLRLDELGKSLQKDSPYSARPGLVTAEEELIAAAETDTSLSPDEQCIEAEASAPYPRSELIELLKRNDRNRAYATESGETILSRSAIIVIADTGLSGYDKKTFPRFTFRTQSPSSYQDGPSLNYGVNIYNRSAPPIEWKEFKRYGHGTHVAGIARGGPELPEEDARFLSARLKLIIASMLDVRSHYNDEDGTHYTASTPSGGIRMATDYAQYQNADILNISFTSTVQLIGLESTIRQQKGFLVVAAAGNSGTNTDYQSNIFPFSYGGTGEDSLVSDQFIVVAASQKNGQLAPFSSYGKKNVDIAAPGCRVLSNSVSDESVAYSGTSEATPLVSFTAALLRFEGITSARHIKARIIASLDRSAALAGKVAWGGKLNIIKALNVYNDIIELRSAPGKLLSGRLSQDETTRLNCEGRISDIASYSKIYRNFDITSDALHALRTGTDKFIKQTPEVCSPVGSFFNFTITGETVPTKIQWSEVQDLIPSYYPFDPQI